MNIIVGLITSEPLSNIQNDNMTNQEAFDAICIHLAEQKSKSLRKMSTIIRQQKFGTALYGIYGMKSAIGALIPIEEYTPDMEGRGVSSIFISDHSTQAILCYTLLQNSEPDEIYWLERKCALRGLNLKMLHGIESIHDYEDTIGGLKKKLSKIAHDYNINGDKIELIQQWGN